MVSISTATCSSSAKGSAAYSLAPPRTGRSTAVVRTSVDDTSTMTGRPCTELEASSNVPRKASPCRVPLSSATIHSAAARGSRPRRMTKNSAISDCSQLSEYRHHFPSGRAPQCRKKTNAHRINLNDGLQLEIARSFRNRVRRFEILVDEWRKYVVCNRQIRHPRATGPGLRRPRALYLVPVTAVQGSLPY